MTIRRVAALIAVSAIATHSTGCAGATAGQPQPERSMAPDSVAAAEEPADVQGYAPEGTDAPPADTTFETNRTTAELTRDVTLRRAMEDVLRLEIAEDIREVQPGILSLLVGPGYGISSTDYNLSRLLAAYRGTVEWDQSAILELWKGHEKLGRYTGSGFRPDPGTASP